MTIKDATARSLLLFLAVTCVALVAKVISSGVSPAARPAMPDGVKVYYLHGNTRCATCQTIEAYAEEAVHSGFADELKAGTIVWEVANYESPGNEHFTTDYQVVAPNVVLVRFQAGQQTAWKSLPEVWGRTGDKAAFVEYVQSSLRNFLAGDQSDGVSPSAVKPAHDGPVKSSVVIPDSPLPIPE